MRIKEEMIVVIVCEELGIKKIKKNLYFNKI